MVVAANSQGVIKVSWSLTLITTLLPSPLSVSYRHVQFSPAPGLEVDGILPYGTPALLSSAWNHTANSFWPTTIPVWKSFKLLCLDAFPRRKICPKCVCGSVQDPTVSLQHSPDTLARFKETTSKGRGGEGRGGEVEGKEETGGKRAERDGREWESRKGKGRSGAYFFPL